MTISCSLQISTTCIDSVIIVNRPERSFTECNYFHREHRNQYRFLFNFAVFIEVDRPVCWRLVLLNAKSLKGKRFALGSSELNQRLFSIYFACFYKQIFTFLLGFLHCWLFILHHIRLLYYNYSLWSFFQVCRPHRQSAGETRQPGRIDEKKCHAQRSQRDRILDDGLRT